MVVTENLTFFKGYYIGCAAMLLFPGLHHAQLSPPEKMVNTVLAAQLTTESHNFIAEPRNKLKKMLLLDFGVNATPYIQPEDIDGLKYHHYLWTYGANANLSVLFLRNDNTDFFIGFDGNVQYDRFASHERLDHFDQKKIFDLYSYCAGGSLGWDTDNVEWIFRGGIVFNSYVDQQISSNTYRITNNSSYGQYAEVLLNFYGESRFGFYMALKYWFNENIESNFNSIHSINNKGFDLPNYRASFKLGIRLGVF